MGMKKMNIEKVAAAIEADAGECGVGVALRGHARSSA